MTAVEAKVILQFSEIPASGSLVGDREEGVGVATINTFWLELKAVLLLSTLLCVVTLFCV